jgi:hypothetical protein
VWVQSGGRLWSTVRDAAISTVTLERGGRLDVTGGGKVLILGTFRWLGGAVTGNGVVEPRNATVMASINTKFLLVRWGNARRFGGNERVFTGTVARRWHIDLSFWEVAESRSLSFSPPPSPFPLPPLRIVWC